MNRMRICAWPWLGALIFIGCGQVDPSKESGESDNTPSGDYYPMNEGNFWRYLETFEPSDDNPETTSELTYEVTGKTTDSVGDGPDREVFVVENLVNITNPSMEEQEKRIQHIWDNGTRSERYRQYIYEYDPLDEALSSLTKERWYNPGFLRFDRSRLQVNVPWEEKLERFSDSKDTTPVESVERTYTFTVLAVDDPVQVPAGNFYCIKVKRISPALEDDEQKTYWFAKGVGKVKEIDEDSTEELIEYSVK